MSRYSSTWLKWQRFCFEKGIHSTSTNINYVLEFLTDLCSNGCHYSGLCAARNALTSLVNIDDCPSITADPLVNRFLKGIF